MILGDRVACYYCSECLPDIFNFKTSQEEDVAMVWGLRYKVKLQARALCQDRYGKLAGLIPQCGEAKAGSVQSSQ
jgi:hypothetical protein